MLSETAFASCSGITDKLCKRNSPQRESKEGTVKERGEQFACNGFKPRACGSVTSPFPGECCRHCKETITSSTRTTEAQTDSIAFDMHI